MTTESQPIYSLLPRLFWMMLGPAILFLIALQIADKGDSWFARADVVFYSVLGGIIFARWLDFRIGIPKTAYGQPATHDILHRYVPAALLCGVAVWIVAKLIGKFALGS